MNRVSVTIPNPSSISASIQGESGLSANIGNTRSIGGASDYDKLKNRPYINGTLLTGDVSLPALGLRGIYYDTTANWNRQGSFVSQEGAVYIYSDRYQLDDGNGNPINVAGMKIGDGTSYLIDIPFLTDVTAVLIAQHASNSEIHVTAEEKTFWNNKVSSFLDSDDHETLVLSKTSFIEGDVDHG